MRINHSELFLIPLHDHFSTKQDVTIIYAPLDEEIILVSAQAAEDLCQYMTQGVEPDDAEIKELAEELGKCCVPIRPDVPDISQCTKLSILPNATCNFACSYCYSSVGRGNRAIGWDKVRATLDYFIDEKRIAPQHVSLFISGGGEPLMSWDVVSKAINYAKTRAVAKGFTIHSSIITNGSLLTEEIARWIREHDCSVGVSFEVLEVLQNKQRKHYSLIKQNIQMIGKLGIRTLLNSTITSQSVRFLSEMVDEVANEFPFVMQYTVEPVTSRELFASTEEIRNFYDSFYSEYIKAKKVAKERGVNLRFTMDEALNGTVVRHCPGKFCLTPEGTISVCHLVSSPKEPRYRECIYGEVDELGKILIDREKFDTLYNKNLFAYPRCEDCFAKWNCGGECMTRNETYPSEYMEEVCRFNRRYVQHLLIEKLSEELEQTTGMTLEEYVEQL